MFKLVLIATLVAGACAQLVPVQQEAAPEPYSYQYATDSHDAAEQRGADGVVTGYYTLADADGRQRRVQYVADANGFRAQVQTNEVGTKNENSADVEVQAAPPTAEQLAQGTTGAQSATLQGQRLSLVQQQKSAVLQAPSSYAFSSGLYNNNYNGLYTNYNGLYSNYNGLYGNLNGQYLRQPAYYGSLNYGNGWGYGLANRQYLSQSLPLSYNYGNIYNQPSTLRTVQTLSAPQQTLTTYRTGYQTVNVPTVSSYRVPTNTVSYQTIESGLPSSSVTYLGAQNGLVRSQSYPMGGIRSSGNYMLLKKREAVAEDKKSSA